MCFSELASIDNNLPSINVPDTVSNSPLPAFLKLDSQAQCISRKKRGKLNARGSWFVTIIGFHSVRILSIYYTVSYPRPYTLSMTRHLSQFYDRIADNRRLGRVRIAAAENQVWWTVLPPSLYRTSSSVDR